MSMDSDYYLTYTFISIQRASTQTFYCFDVVLYLVWSIVYGVGDYLSNYVKEPFFDVRVWFEELFVLVDDGIACDTYYFRLFVWLLVLPER